MTYVPRPFSITAQAIDVIETEGSIVAAVLAERIGQDANTVKSCLSSALDHGMVKRERRQDGQWIYSVGNGVPLRASGDGMPVQRTVSAADVSPGVDIDLVHKNRPWRQPLEESGGFACALRADGRLLIMRSGNPDLLLSAEQAEALRLFFSEPTE